MIWVRQCGVYFCLQKICGAATDFQGAGSSGVTVNLSTARGVCFPDEKSDQGVDGMSLVALVLAEMNLIRAGLASLRNRDQKTKIGGQFHKVRWETRPGSVDYEADVLLVPSKIA